MGGPSKDDLYSEEFVSKWIDNEFENEIERSFFERTLEHESHSLRTASVPGYESSTELINRVEKQLAAKHAISELFKNDNLQPIDTVKIEIRKLVHSSLNKVGMEKIQDTEDEFENIRLQDDRFIISQYIDEELDLNSFSESDVKEIIKSSPENTRFYQDLVRTKRLTKSLIDTKNLEPTDNVAKQIRNLVGSMDATERDNRAEFAMSMKYDTRFDEQLKPRAMMYPPNASDTSDKNTEGDPWDKIGLEETDKKSSKVNWFNFKKYSMPSVPQMASLAAVFAFGVVIAPTLYETVKFPSDIDRIVLRGGSDTLLTSEYNNELISFKQDGDGSVFSALKSGPEPVASNTPFTLQFIVPITGDVSIYVNASVENDRKLVLQGQKYDLGYFEKNKIIKFPETRALKVGQEDQLLRVDFSIQNENEDILITRWFKIDYSIIETIKPGE